MAISSQAQVIVTNDTTYQTAEQMFLANELFKSGEPFAEALGYNLDDLDPMTPNSPDSTAYALGIEGYEYSRYALGNVVSRSGLGLHIIWSPMIGMMAAGEPTGFDGSLTGTPNGYNEDDEMMKMVGRFSQISNQPPPANPFPQFAEFEGGDPRLPQTVASNFQMDFSTLRWDRSKMNKTLNLAGMGQSLLKQYYWAQDMLGAFHDGQDEGIDPDGTVSPDAPGSISFDPNNDVFYGGNALDGFIGQILTAEGINKTLFLINGLAYDGTNLGGVDPATYDPANGIKYFPHNIAVTETMVSPTMPPKPSSFTVTDANSELFDQASYLLAALNYKNMMDIDINDEAHNAYKVVFDGDPFPAPMSVTGTPGPFDLMMGTSKVIFQNLMAMHFDAVAGTFVDVSTLAGGSVNRGTDISAANAGYMLEALVKFAQEFAGTPLEPMAVNALNAQASFIMTKMKDADGGYFNTYSTVTGGSSTPKSAMSQAAIEKGLYVAYQYTNNTDYLTAADAAYQFLISNFYVAAETAFRTQMGNQVATYTPKNLAFLSGALREATLIGGHTEAASIYTRFSKKVYNPLLMAEAEQTGETGNDSDNDGIPYVAGGNMPMIFASEGEYLFQVSAVKTPVSIVGVSTSPNPATDVLSVQVDLKTPSEIRLKLYDLTGHPVQSIISENVAAGSNAFQMNVGGLPNGLYLLKVEEANGTAISRKVSILK